MSKHTPGPWFIGDANKPSEYTHGIQAGDFIVADLCDDAHTAGTRRANARLIAAAPELLEALKGLLNVISETRGIPAHEAVQASLAAIAKAEGKK